MSMPQNVIAIVFDFDDTLTDDSTTKLLEKHGVDTADFWQNQMKKRFASVHSPKYGREDDLGAIPRAAHEPSNWYVQSRPLWLQAVHSARIATLQRCLRAGISGPIPEVGPDVDELIGLMLMQRFVRQNSRITANGRANASKFQVVFQLQ